MTEDEAKTKWCPHSRRTFDITKPGIAGSMFPDGSWRPTCIASACMMWRWGQERNPDWKPKHHMFSTTPVHPDDDSQPYVKSETDGYCGLAGRP